MNFYDYGIAKAKNPNFDDENCFYLRPNQIERVQHEAGNEVRTTVLTSDKQLRAEIQQEGGNHTPISVHGGPDIFHQDDGHNRIREIIALGITQVKCIMSDFKSKEDRKWKMLNDNIYPAHTEATTSDIANTLVSAIKDDFVLGSDFASIEKEDIIELLRAKVKKSFHGNAENSIVKKVVEELASGNKKYLNYGSKEDAAKKFSDINPWGLKVSKSGDESEDKNGQVWAVYFAGTEVWINQNGVHGCLRKKGKAIKKGLDIKTLLVGYDEKIVNSNGDLDNFREKQIKAATSVNENPFLKGKLYDRYVALPQVLIGINTEDTNKLVKSLDI